MRSVEFEPACESVQQGPKQVLVTYEGASSPRELLESCCIQARAALRGLRSTACNDEFGTEKEEDETILRLSKAEAAERDEERREEERQDENFVLKEFWFVFRLTRAWRKLK